MSITKILALDPANKVGYAHTSGIRGTVSIARKGDDDGARLARFYEWLRTTLDAHETHAIAAEDASFGSRNPSVQASHNELRGIIKLVGAQAGIPVTLYAPTTIKAFATGSGRADKAQMMAACRLQLRIEPSDDNEADALWILALETHRRWTA